MKEKGRACNKRLRQANVQIYCVWCLSTRVNGLELSHRQSVLGLLVKSL
jgi:hypothetical protein